MAIKHESLEQARFRVGYGRLYPKYPPVPVPSAAPTMPMVAIEDADNMAQAYDPAVNFTTSNRDLNEGVLKSEESRLKPTPTSVRTRPPVRKVERKESLDDKITAQFNKMKGK